LGLTYNWKKAETFVGAQVVCKGSNLIRELIPIRQYGRILFDFTTALDSSICESIEGTNTLPGARNTMNNTL
jgi:hypothetical protein